MRRYVFIHDDIGTFIVRARNQRNAIKGLIRKVDGRFGFFKGLKQSNIKEDISMGSILVYKETK